MFDFFPAHFSLSLTKIPDPANLSEIAVRPRIPPLPECREDCDRRVSYETKKKIEECLDIGGTSVLCNLQGRAHENDAKSKCLALAACSLRGIPVRYGIGK